MALAETAVVANELEKVESKVPTLFEREALFFSSIEKRQAEVISNRDMRVPMELRPGGLFGHYDPAGGDLGRGEGPFFDKAVVNTVHLKHAVEWHKKAQWATDDKRKAVVDTFRHLLAKAMMDFRRHTDALCMTDGSGVLGTISANSGANPYTLTLGTDGFGAKLLQYGQKVSIYQSDLTAVRANGAEASVSFYDVANKQVQVTASGAVAITNGDKLVISGLTGDVSSGLSIKGVPYHHNNASAGTWLGLDRATNPEIRANAVNAAGNLALAHARLALYKVMDRLGEDGLKKMTAWMHPCQVAAYENLGQLVQMINRGGGKSQGLDLYFDVQQLAGVPIKKSTRWDKTRIDFIANDVWGRAEFHPAGFYTEEGRKIFELRGASGGVAAASIFYIVASFQLYVNNPAACTYIYGLSVPAGY